MRIVVLALLTSCSTGLSTTVCPEGDAQEAVRVTLADADGQPVPRPSVRWTLDDGQEGDCEAVDEDGATWHCAYELFGTFTITGDGWGFDPVTTEAIVEKSGCNLDTALLDLTLPAIDCPDEEVPSLEVLVVQRDSSAVPDARAEFVPTEEDWTQPEPCDQLDARTFTCGGEYLPQIDLWVYGTGFRDHFETVTVDEDECGVVTTDVTVVMQPG